METTTTNAASNKVDNTPKKENTCTCKWCYKPQSGELWPRTDVTAFFNYKRKQ